MTNLAHRLDGIPPTIFSAMSALAASTGSVNLGQGFPDADGPASVIAAAERALAGGANQYAPGIGVPALRQAIARHQQRRYGIDLDDGVMPEEAGIVDRAVSFKKGCYVGQETVARLHWKGKPNRHLRGLRLSAPADAGTPVLSGDREVGHLASSVTSPRLGPIALAILRREVSPGDHVTIAGADAEVVAPPFA